MNSSVIQIGDIYYSKKTLDVYKIKEIYLKNPGSSLLNLETWIILESDNLPLVTVREYLLLELFTQTPNYSTFHSICRFVGCPAPDQITHVAFTEWGDLLGTVEDNLFENFMFTTSNGWAILQSPSFIVTPEYCINDFNTIIELSTSEETSITICVRNIIKNVLKNNLEKIS